MGDGFVFGWINPWQDTAELFELLQPNYVAQPLPFDRDRLLPMCKVILPSWLPARHCES